MLRDVAPTMPWELRSTDQVDRDFFTRLAARRGSAFALRHWNHLADFNELLRESDGDDTVQDYDIRVFGNRLQDEDPQDAREFFEVLKLYRLIEGGTTRRTVARLLMPAKTPARKGRR
jgi:hypothetical protein